MVAHISVCACCSGSPHLFRMADIVALLLLPLHGVCFAGAPCSSQDRPKAKKIGKLGSLPYLCLQIRLGQKKIRDAVAW